MTKELEQDILYQAKTILDKINKSPDEYKNNPMTQNLMKWYEALIDAVTAEPQESDESLNKRMPALQEELLGSDRGLETSHSDEDDEDDEDMEEDHFGEEQAEGLDSLLEGLKDTPHDNRW